MIVERGGQLDGDRPVRATWERAAIAEAKRLARGLASPVAARVRMGSVERVRVTAPGYCHLFGGLYDKRVGWQANDLGEC